MNLRVYITIIINKYCALILYHIKTKNASICFNFIQFFFLIILWRQMLCVSGFRDYMLMKKSLQIVLSLLQNRKNMIYLI